MTLISTNKRWITVIIVVWPSYVFVEFIFPTTHCVVVYKIQEFYGGIQGDWGKKFCLEGLKSVR